MEEIKYSMKDILKLLKISDTTIRKYEEKGLIDIKRLSNSYREFTLRDLTKLISIRNYVNLGYSLNEIKDVLNSSYPTELVDKLNNHIMAYQQQIEEIKNNIDILEKQTKLVEDVTNNKISREIINMPNFEFHDSSTSIEGIDTFAFMFTKEQLYHESIPVLGYIKYLENPKELNQLCLHTMYRFDKKNIGGAGHHLAYDKDLEYLKSNNYEIIGNSYSIKLFSFVKSEDEIPIDYYEAYFPIRKIK